MDDYHLRKAAPIKRRTSKFLCSGIWFHTLGLIERHGRNGLILALGRLGKRRRGNLNRGILQIGGSGNGTVHGGVFASGVPHPFGFFIIFSNRGRISPKLIGGLGRGKCGWGKHPPLGKRGRHLFQNAGNFGILGRGGRHFPLGKRGRQWSSSRGKFGSFG